MLIISASTEILIAHCQAALQRDPGYHQARLRLAEILRINHRNAEAEVEYTTYLTRKPDDPMGFPWHCTKRTGHGQASGVRSLS